MVAQTQNKLNKMKYTGNTPMPDIILTDDINWSAIRIKALHPVIQDKIKQWNFDGKFVMINTSTDVAICLHTIGTKCVILYFE
jgi:hypothetical protein